MKLFFDENIGYRVPEALRLVDVAGVDYLTDMFAIAGQPAQGVRDEDWIPAIGSSHLVISLDKRLLRRPSQRKLLMDHNVGIVCLTSAHAAPREMLAFVLRRFLRLEQLDANTQQTLCFPSVTSRPIRAGALDASSAATLPLMLSPYRVIDLTDERGVLAGQMLADLGADVIQVEPPTGSTGRAVAPFFADHPDESIYWAAYTRGKRGITCDLEQSRGRDLLIRLLETADFLIESSDVGAMAELGLDYQTLHDRFPQLIYTSISAFGQTGPKAQYVGSDLAIWAAGTPLLMSGDDDRAPVRISQPQAWGHASGDAAGGSMLALHARHQTGRGQHVDISAQVSAAQATLAQVLAHQLGAVDPERYGGGVKIRGQAIRGTADVADGYIVLLMGPGPAVGHFANHAVKWLVDIGAAEPELLDENFVTYADRVATGQGGPGALPPHPGHHARGRRQADEAGDAGHLDRIRPVAGAGTRHRRPRRQPPTRSSRLLAGDRARRWPPRRLSGTAAEHPRRWTATGHLSTSAA